MAATGSKANWFENVVLDWALGNQAYTVPTGIFIGLFTSALDDTMTTGAGEIFQRFSAAADLENWTTAAGGSKNNAVAFQWPTATADMGTAKYFAIMESGAGAGRGLYWGELATGKIIGSGDVFRFPSGAITITED